MRFFSGEGYVSKNRSKPQRMSLRNVGLIVVMLRCKLAITMVILACLYFITLTFQGISWAKSGLIECHHYEPSDFFSSQMFFLVLVTGGTCPMKNDSFIILKRFVRLDET